MGEIFLVFWEQTATTTHMVSMLGLHTETYCLKSMWSTTMYMDWRGKWECLLTMVSSKITIKDHRLHKKWSVSYMSNKTFHHRPPQACQDMCFCPLALQEKKMGFPIMNLKNRSYLWTVRVGTQQQQYATVVEDCTCVILISNERNTTYDI